jgi:hypothetical protein
MSVDIYFKPKKVLLNKKNKCIYKKLVIASVDRLPFMTASLVLVCQESSFTHQLMIHKMCYRKDGGWSPGFVLQDVIPNHHKLLWSKNTVVNRLFCGTWEPAH